MRNLAEDLDECGSDAERRLVRKLRREAGLERSDQSVWTAYEYHDGGAHHDRALVSLGRSPGDVLLASASRAGQYADRRGTGYWILERLGGDEGNHVLRISCALDEGEN